MTAISMVYLSSFVFRNSPMTNLAKRMNAAVRKSARTTTRNGKPTNAPPSQITVSTFGSQRNQIVPHAAVRVSRKWSLRAFPVLSQRRQTSLPSTRASPDSATQPRFSTHGSLGLLPAQRKQRIQITTPTQRSLKSFSFASPSCSLAQNQNSSSKKHLTIFTS